MPSVVTFAVDSSTSSFELGIGVGASSRGGVVGVTLSLVESLIVLVVVAAVSSSWFASLLSAPDDLAVGAESEGLRLSSLALFLRKVR